MAKNGKYTDMIPADSAAKDTSELSTKVRVESSRPAKFSKCERFLTDCGAVIPVEDLDDMLYDLEHGLKQPVFVEYLTEKTLQKSRQGVLVDIGGQDVISHARLVLRSNGSDRRKVLEAYNPHNKTIETLVYRGEQQNVPARDPTARGK